MIKKRISLPKPARKRGADAVRWRGIASRSFVLSARSPSQIPIAFVRPATHKTETKEELKGERE